MSDGDERPTVQLHGTLYAVRRPGELTLHESMLVSSLVGDVQSTPEGFTSDTVDSLVHLLNLILVDDVDANELLDTDMDTISTFIEDAVESFSEGDEQ